MPTVGVRHNYDNMGSGYDKDPLYSQAKDFLRFNQNIVSESGGVLDMLRNPGSVVSNNAQNENLKNYFVSQSVNEAEYENDPEGLEDELHMMSEMYENDREVATEQVNLAAMNPMMGMTFPIHKNILMNSIYDKGGIPKVVAVQPKFTISMEKRYIVAPDGKKYDMFLEQNMISKAMNASNPFVDIELTLPERGTTNILEKMGAGTADHLSIRTYISKVLVPCKYKTGETLPDGTTAAADTTADTWINVNILFSPQYGENDRHTMDDVILPTNVDSDQTKDTLAGYMKEDRIYLTAIQGVVKSIKLSAAKDITNGLNNNCSVQWLVNTTPVEIPEMVHLNVPIAPEEVKDIGALYQVNQLTKVMGMIKLCLENFKDDGIRKALSDSYDRLPSNCKFYGTFDCFPREGFGFSSKDYREQSFMDLFDTYITDLLAVLNDPNVTIGVFGRQDLVRKMTPTDHVYHTPPNIGPVSLDFNKTVATTDNRVYQFMSSQKLNKADDDLSLDRDDLTVVLNPRNTSRIIYRIYDYQMYASNEIRNAVQYPLPAIDAFERWKFVEYQPVQGRVRMINPRGYHIDEKTGVMAP